MQPGRSPGIGNGQDAARLGGRRGYPRAGAATVDPLRPGERAGGSFRASIPERLVDLHAHTRLDVRQANARVLPFAEGSFDLVYSVLALELMDDIRAEVLAEMRRVSRRARGDGRAVYEWHASGHRRDLIAAKGYFAQPIEGLDTFGLEPIVAMADMPHKLDYQPGLVVAKAR